MKHPIAISALTYAAICIAHAAGQAETPTPIQKLAAAEAKTAMSSSAMGARGTFARKAAARFDGQNERLPDLFGRASERKPSRVREAWTAALEFHDDESDLPGAGISRSIVSTNYRRARGETSANREAVEIRAAFIQPREGARLDATQVFEWTEGASPQMYWLWVGSCRDCTDIVDFGTMERSYTASLPTDGRAIYATLFTLYNGAWYWYDYTFRGPDMTGAKAEMTSPSHGDTLQRTQTFRWSAGLNVLQYYLWIGSCQDCTDILDESQGLERSRTVSLPDDGRTIFVTLFSHVNGAWHWVDYQYRAPSQQSGTQDVSITITNRLYRSINIEVNGEVVGSVPAFETRTHSARLSELQLKWEFNAPTLSGRALGDTMRGAFTAVSSPTGEYRYEVDNVIGSNWFFAPYITNQTGISLLIEANGGLESQNRCNCTAPNGSTNVATGYYKLFTNSNVRLWRGDSNYTGRYRFWGTDSDGRVAGSRLPDAAETKSGILRITATTAP